MGIADLFDRKNGLEELTRQAMEIVFGADPSPERMRDFTERVIRERQLAPLLTYWSVVIIAIMNGFDYVEGGLYLNDQQITALVGILANLDLFEENQAERALIVRLVRLASESKFEQFGAMLTMLLVGAQDAHVTIRMFAGLLAKVFNWQWPNDTRDTQARVGYLRLSAFEAMNIARHAPWCENCVKYAFEIARVLDDRVARLPMDEEKKNDGSTGNADPS